MSDLYTIKRIAHNIAETQVEIARLEVQRAAIYNELTACDNMIDLHYRKLEDYNDELKQWEAKYTITAITKDSPY